MVGNSVENGNFTSAAHPLPTRVDHDVASFLDRLKNGPANRDG